MAKKKLTERYKLAKETAELFEALWSIWDRLKKLPFVTKIISLIVGALATYLSAVVAAVPLWAVLMIALLTVWGALAMFNELYDASEKLSLDTTDVKAYGKEVREFSDDALRELRNFHREYPKAPDVDADGHAQWQYNADKSAAVKAYVAANYLGKASAHLIRLKAFGLDLDRGILWGVSHHPASFLAFLSQVGHLLEAGGLNEARSITRDDTWNLSSMISGM